MSSSVPNYETPVSHWLLTNEQIWLCLTGSWLCPIVQTLEPSFSIAMPSIIKKGWGKNMIN